MDDILILLLKKGAHKTPIRLSTTQLGSELGMSQQNASRRLQELEKEGRIERKDGKVRLGPKAISLLSELAIIMKNAFWQETLSIRGTIVSGLGEGKYYLLLQRYRKQVKEKLGFDPYPGTLNIKLDETELWKREYFIQNDPIMIDGFKDGERTYGDLFAYPCKIEGSDVPCALIIPLRTHHPQSIIEIIAPDNLKEKFRKKDGDQLAVII